MKNKTIALIGFVVATCPVVNAAIVVGSGPDTSYFVIESPGIGIREYEINYTYDAGDTLGTTDLLNLIDAADSFISFDITNFGSTLQPNEFLNSITFNGVVEANDFSAANSSWSQWLAGGQAGAENTSPFDPAPVPLAEDSWSFGSGLSNPYRIVEPGSTDALVFGGGEPSVAPIPEPGSLMLLLVASGGILRRRRG